MKKKDIRAELCAGDNNVAMSDMHQNRFASAPAAPVPAQGKDQAESGERRQ